MARRIVAAAALVVSAVGLGGGVADAATELRLSPATGPAGTGFTVTGSGFAAADVEIHWDSQTGPLLATATGPDFSVGAVVPDSPPNSHPVVAVVRSDERVSTSSAAFQVTPGGEPVVTTTTTVADPATTTPPVTAAADPAPPTTSPPPTALPTGATDASARAEVDAAVAKALAESNASVAAALASVDVAVAAAANATTAPGPGGVGPGAAPGAPTPSTLPGPGGAAGTLPGPGATPGSPASSVPAGTALAPGSAVRRSAGARPPVMLLVALALIVGAALVLVVRNRDRFGRPGRADAPASDAPLSPPVGMGHNRRP